MRLLPSHRRSSLLALATTLLLLITVPNGVFAEHAEHGKEGEDTHQKDQQKDKQQQATGGDGQESQVTSSIPQNYIKQEGNTITVNIPGAFHISFKNCLAVGGRDGATDLTPVFDSLKGCPTGMVKLLSPAEGGPQAYTWQNTSSMDDIGNLLLFGAPAKSLFTSNKNKDKDNKKDKDGNPLPTLPTTTIQLSGDGPLRTGPWAATNIAFVPSPTEPLTSTPFVMARGDADLRDVSFAGFNDQVFKVSDGYVLKVLNGVFTKNTPNPTTMDAIMDVEGGTIYCHRCHFSQNANTAITATGPDSLVGLSFSKFVNNNAEKALVSAVDGAKGGFASSSFINNTVSGGGLVRLVNGSIFLGQNSLFRDNVGGDLLAEDSHYRVDKTLFTGSSLASSLVGDESEEGAVPSNEQGTRRRLQDLAAATLMAGHDTDNEEGSVARLYGSSSLRGFNVYMDQAQGPAIASMDASNVTLARPCFTNDQATATADAKFVQAAAEAGELVLWGACAFSTNTNEGEASSLPDVSLEGMDPAHVALTPFSDLSIGGQAKGVMKAQNGTCLRHCAADFVAPVDWDPSKQPPPSLFMKKLSFPPGLTIFISDKGSSKGNDKGKSSSSSSSSNSNSGSGSASIPAPPQIVLPEDIPLPPSDVQFDERTGTINVKYPDGYKGPQLPSFQVPFPFGGSPPSGKHTLTRTRTRRHLRGGQALDKVVVLNVVKYVRALLHTHKEQEAAQGMTTPRKVQTINIGGTSFKFDEDAFNQDPVAFINSQIGGSSPLPPPPPPPVAPVAPVAPVVAVAPAVVVEGPVVPVAEGLTEMVGEEGEEEEEEEKDASSSTITTTSESEAEKEEMEEEYPEELAALYSLFGAVGAQPPPIPEEMLNGLPVTIITTTSTEGEKEEVKEGDAPSSTTPTTTTPPTPPTPLTPEEEEAAALLKLQNDVSAPWDNNRDKDSWTRPDWSFLQHFPLIPNVPTSTNSEEKKQAVKAARAYEAYTAFLQSNPGVALPSSAVTTVPTEPTTEEEEKDATESTPTDTVEAEAPVAGGDGESETVTDTDTDKVLNDNTILPGEPNPSTPAPTIPTDEEEATTTLPDGVCAEGETPLILYLDSGSTGGENQECMALVNSTENATAAFYFVAMAGDQTARTLPLPEGTTGEDVSLLQILDLGCQAVEGNPLEVELRNELLPDVVCSRWTVADWAGALLEGGATVSIDEEGGVDVVLAPVPVEPVVVPEATPVPVIADEVSTPMPPDAPPPLNDLPTAAKEEEVPPPAGTRHHHHQRKLQETTTTTIGDVPAEEGQAPAAGVAPPTPTTTTTNTTTTLITIPIMMDDAEGGSSLTVVLITDPDTLNQSLGINLGIPGVGNINGTVGLPPASPSSAQEKAAAPLDGAALAADGTSIDTQAANAPAKKAGGGAGAVAGGVIGGLLIVAFIAAGVVVYRRHRGNGGDLAFLMRTSNV